MSFDPKKVNLDKLSREEMMAVIDMLDEQERRRRLTKIQFHPNLGQFKVHKSKAQLRCVFSGNGAGKTTSAVQEAGWVAQGYNPIHGEYTPVPARVIVVIDHPEKADTVWIPELLKWFNISPEQLQKRGRHSTSAIVFDNGSEILFFTHSQDPLAFESIECDAAIFDEPPPRSIWIGLRRAGRKKDTQPMYLIVGTPLMGSWMRQEILEPWEKGEFAPGEVECFTFGTRVNEKNLADGYIESFSKHLSEKEKRIRLEGQFFDLDGLALAHLLKREVHEIKPFEWKREWSCVVAIDPHQAKPHHAILLGCDNDGYLYYIKELRLKCVARDFALELKKWYQGYRVTDIVCDSLGSSETSGGEGFKSFIQVLRENGVQVRATTWDEKSDEDFIHRIQQCLVIPDEANSFGIKAPKLRFFKGQSNGCISDIANVSWVKEKTREEYKPKLDISNKDFLSCLKYALSTNLGPKKAEKTTYHPVKRAETYTGRNVAKQLNLFPGYKRPKR
jgi:hypothetical protein